MDGYFFISYAHSDEATGTERVLDLGRALESRGISIWLDRLGSVAGIPYSTLWKQAIYEGIYSASGAIIFETELYGTKPVCQEERATIKRTQMPSISISTHGRDIEELADSMAQWCQGILGDEKNETRTHLFSYGYRHWRGAKTRHLMPKPRGIHNESYYINKFNNDLALVRKEGYANSDPLIGPEMLSYLNEAKREIMLRRLARILLLIVFVVGIVVAVILMESYKKIHTVNEAAAKGYETFGYIDDLKELSPAYGLRGLDTQANSLDPHANFTGMVTEAVNLLSMNYPSRFYPAGSPDAEALSALETVSSSERFALLPGAQTACLRIHDRISNRWTVLTLPTSSSVYSFAQDGAYIVFSFGSRVQVYDLGGIATRAILAPAELVQNFESIVQVGFEGDMVYAITEKGNAVEWENPFAKPTDPAPLDQQNPSTCAVMEVNELGLPICVWKDGDTVRWRIGAGSTSVSLEQYGTLVEDSLSVDRNCTCVSAICLDPDDTQKLIRISLPDAQTEELAQLDIGAYGTCFSTSGSGIAVAGSRALAHVQLSTGQVSLKYREDGDRSYRSISPSGNGYLLTDEVGRVAVLDSDFERKGDWIHASPQNLPLKQAVATKNQKYLFMANRGGATVESCMRISLEKGTSANIVVDCIDGMVSNTSVAVSADDGLVAYGYPNGDIRVFDTHLLCPVFADTSVGEPLVAIAFASDNSRLFALGSSGALYTIEGRGLLNAVNPDDYEASWQPYGAAIKSQLDIVEAMGLVRE